MDLRTYVIRRLLLLAPVLIGITLLIFAVLSFLPLSTRLTAYVRDANELRPENIEKTIQAYHLNDPIWVQYYVWLGGLLGGNLGTSASGERVTEALIRRFPATAELAIYASFIIIFGGIWLGTVSAVKKDKPADHATRTMSIAGWSLPTFWLGLMILMFFYGGYGILGPGRLDEPVRRIVEGEGFVRYTKLNSIDAILNLNWTVFIDAIEHLILPVFTLAFVSWAIITRIMRSSMIEVLSKDYLKLAKAKGAPDKIIIKKHARRNALIPVATVSGFVFAGLLNGVVITETVFAINGIGKFAADAAINVDVAAVLGFTIFNAILLVLTNLIVDLLYAYIDPRIRLE
ncbi:MAG: ABC transporter permease [Candidatus Geothermarchaeales archaeon]